MPTDRHAPIDLSLGVDTARLADALRWADDAYRDCKVCAIACGVDRTAGPTGVCGLGMDARVYKEYLHLGEESALVPSHTIFMTGCSFRCPFCSDDRFVRSPLNHGVSLPPEALAKRIAERREQGATNVNFVGGVPDVNLHYILRTLTHCPADTHVVWNTNLWTPATVIDQLDGIVGTWLGDYKFGNDRCGLKWSGGSRAYIATVQAAIAQAVAGRSNVIIRHLVMPGHVECCTLPVIAAMAAKWPAVPLNLMLGYHPFQLAGKAGAMGGRLNPTESRRALEAAQSADIALWVDGSPVIRGSTSLV